MPSPRAATPTTRRMAARTRDLAAIHIAKNRLSMPDDAYRMQVRLASGGQQQPDGTVTGGHDSAAVLSTEQRAVLLTAMQERLAQAGIVRRPAAGRRKVRRGPAAVPDAKAALAAKVEALLLDAERGDSYANSIARNRFACQRWEWLPFHQMEDLMQMLIIDQTRRAMRRGLAALAEGRPWAADLTPGEIEAGVDVAAAREAIRRGLASEPGIDVDEYGRIIITARGLEAVRAMHAEA